MNRRTPLLVAVLAISVLSGCAGDGTGFPNPVAPECDGLEPRLQCIQEQIFTPTCAVSNCHDAGTASSGQILEEGFTHGSRYCGC